MWIFKNDAFVSIVQDRDMDDQVWVRGRIRGDVERFMGKGYDLEVIETNDADYRFRACVPKADAAARAMEAVTAIKYDNFKGSIDERKANGRRRHDAYLRVWSAMMSYQRNEHCREGGYVEPDLQVDWASHIQDEAG